MGTTLLNGVAIRNQRIFIQAATTTTSANVATLVLNAINNSNAGLWFTPSIDPIAGNRIDLNRVSPEVQTARLTTNGTPAAFQLQAKGTLVKGYRDVTYMIGHDVLNEGPLGLEDQLLTDPIDPVTGDPDFQVNNDLLGDPAHFVQRGQDPLEMFRTMWPAMRERYGDDPRAFAAHVKKFVRMFCAAQWKRERFAISFRVAAFDLDPKTGFRFPPVQAPFLEELAELDRHVDELCRGRG